MFDYTPPTVHIPLPKSEGFKVHGLTLDDITILITMNIDDLVAAVAYYQQQRESSFTKDAMTNIILVLTKNFPQLMSEILSTCSDSWGTPRQMRTLPAGVQVVAISEILRLTIEDMGGLKNSFGLIAETVTGALRASDTRTALERPLQGSRSASDAT